MRVPPSWPRPPTRADEPDWKLLTDPTGPPEVDVGEIEPRPRGREEPHPRLPRPFAPGGLESPPPLRGPSLQAPVAHEPRPLPVADSLAIQVRAPDLTRPSREGLSPDAALAARRRAEAIEELLPEPEPEEDRESASEIAAAQVPADLDIPDLVAAPAEEDRVAEVLARQQHIILDQILAARLQDRDSLVAIVRLVPPPPSR